MENKQGEIFLRDVVNLISDIIWEVDSGWRLTYISVKIEASMGFRTEELIGKTLFELMPDNEVIRLRNILNSISQEKSHITDIEACFISKNGEHKFFVLNGIPVPEKAGSICGYRGIAKDITDKKRAVEAGRINESRFRNLFESNPQGIIIADKNGYIIQANRRWKKIFGYSETDMAGLHINDFRQNHDKECDWKLLTSLYNNEIESYRIERVFLRKDGTDFWCNLTARLIEDPEAEDLCAIGVYIDITERKRAEQELQKFRDELEQIVSERTDEIKKLNLKVINSQEIERQRIARDLHDGVGQTVLAAKFAFNSFTHGGFKDCKFFERGMTLIGMASQELREIYSGLYPSILSDLGLNDTIHWFIRNYLEPSGLQVEYQYTIKSALSHNLSVNMYRIIQELFNNVIKHSEADIVRVMLKEQGGHIIIQICDNGIGFDIVKVQKRASGAGFVNIRQRVESLCGRFDVCSEQGNTSILIKLPVGNS